MRRLLTTALIAALVGGVLGGLSLAAGSTSPDSRLRTLRLLEVRTSVHQVDVGVRGPSIGDEFIFRSIFRNPQDTRTLGHNTVLCIALSRLSADCNGTATFDGGALRFGQKTGQTGSRFVFAIVGGSGKYRGVDGQVTVQKLNADGSRALDTVLQAGCVWLIRAHASRTGISNRPTTRRRGREARPPDRRVATGPCIRLG